MQVRDPDYSPEMAGRLSKLESAISKQRTIKFSYWSPRRDQTRERTLNPYALRRDRGTWYVVGHDLDSGDVRTFRVSRVRSDIRFATRRERDFRLPADFDVDAYRVGEDWQHGPVAGTARIEVNGDTAWWVHRTLHEAGVVAGLGAFVGHLFPVWLRFKGGKGVATYIGILLGLTWPAALAFCAIWLAVAAVTRYSSLAALIASAATPAVLLATSSGLEPVLFGLLTVILWVTHRENIARLLQGTEGKIGQKV